MARPTAMDEYFVHQIPQLLPEVVVRHRHWRESFFYEIHDPSGEGDVFFFTMAHYPASEGMDSLQMGRIGGERVAGYRLREDDGDPHTLEVAGARVEVIRPFEEVRISADANDSGFAFDLTWRARTKPYGLRRGTMRAGDDLVWDQSHILQSGVYQGTYTAGGRTFSVDGWIGQRDHSWGIRDHARCPLWLWWQIQLEDGFLGVWHWELADGATVYTDGCWAATDGSDPVPVTGFSYDADWIGTDGSRGGYGEHGDDTAGLAAHGEFTLADGRRIRVEASGSFVQPYEPHHRGGLNLMKVRADDGRTGTAIYEVTGAHHHHFFPDTVVEGVLPS